MEEHKTWKPPYTQVAFQFPRSMYVEFKSFCLVHDTNPNRLVHIWIQRQVEAWRQEQRKEMLPKEVTNADDLHHTP